MEYLHSDIFTIIVTYLNFPSYLSLRRSCKTVYVKITAQLYPKALARILMRNKIKKLKLEQNWKLDPRLRSRIFPDIVDPVYLGIKYQKLEFLRWLHLNHPECYQLEDRHSEGDRYYQHMVLTIKIGNIAIYNFLLTVWSSIEAQSLIHICTNLNSMPILNLLLNQGVTLNSNDITNLCFKGNLQMLKRVEEYLQDSIFFQLNNNNLTILQYLILNKYRLSVNFESWILQDRYILEWLWNNDYTFNTGDFPWCIAYGNLVALNFYIHITSINVIVKV